MSSVHPIVVRAPSFWFFSSSLENERRAPCGGRRRRSLLRRDGYFHGGAEAPRHVRNPVSRVSFPAALPAAESSRTAVREGFAEPGARGRGDISDSGARRGEARSASLPEGVYSSCPKLVDRRHAGVLKHGDGRAGATCAEPVGWVPTLHVPAGRKLA